MAEFEIKPVAGEQKVVAEDSEAVQKAEQKVKLTAFFRSMERFNDLVRKGEVNTDELEAEILQTDALDIVFFNELIENNEEYKGLLEDRPSGDFIVLTMVDRLRVGIGKMDSDWRRERVDSIVKNWKNYYEAMTPVRETVDLSSN